MCAESTRSCWASATAHGGAQGASVADQHPPEPDLRAQQNDIVRRLTIVASVFLPLTFITGFFGQNFLWLVNEIDTATAFWAVGIGSPRLSCVVLLIWFKRFRYL